MIVQNTDQKNCLLQILTCLICQNKADQAHICPNCSKFYCFACIKNWIDSNQAQCPYCCKSLEQKQLVNCQKLCVDLSNALQKINYTKNSQLDDNSCVFHNLKRNYYCKTCQQSVCSDCCVLVKQHKGHEFVKLSQIKRQFQKKNSAIKQKLSSFKEQVIKLKDKFQRDQKMLHKDTISTNQQKFKIMDAKLKQFKDKITKKFANQLSDIQQNLYQERNNLIDGQKMYQKLMKQLKQCPKQKLIGSQSNFIEQLILSEKKKLIQSTNKSKKVIQTFCQKNFQSELIPAYHSKKFTLDNYTQLKLDRNVIYSEYFIVDGLQWRLKIYPSGIEEDQENEDCPKRLKVQKKPSFQFISIFIQLKQGFQQLGRYRHKIQLINQIHANKKISREFQSQFQIGSCWGYNQFAKINTLYQEDYIHPETDQIQIVLYIASSTYYHANLDLQKLLAMKKKRIEQNQAKIKTLILSNKKSMLINVNLQQKQQQNYQQLTKACQQIRFAQQTTN